MFHHLLIDEDRTQSFQEMLRIMKPNAYGILTCWSTEQPVESRRQFVEGVNVVPWKGRKNIDKTRYYFVYSEQMFKEYFEQFSDIQIENIYNEAGNWVMLFRKTKNLPIAP
jgi:hypothetical protein